MHVLIISFDRARAANVKDMGRACVNFALGDNPANFGSNIVHVAMPGRRNRESLLKNHCEPISQLKRRTLNVLVSCHPSLKMLANSDSNCYGFGWARLILLTVFRPQLLLSIRRDGLLTRSRCH